MFHHLQVLSAIVVGWCSLLGSTTLTQVSSFTITSSRSTIVRVGHIQPSGYLTILNNSKNNQEEGNVVNDLLQKAEQLRKEVTKFEKGKEEEERKAQLQREELLQQKRNKRLRYSATVPILKGDGSEVMEQVDFPPRIGGDQSVILAVQASLPLGIILGEDEELPGVIAVDEVVEGSNGMLAGVEEGDVLRACTACQVSMEMPTWQLMAGGIGRPKTSRMMFSTDNRPFEEVMEAVGSNRMDPEERPVWLVLERVVN